MTAAAASRALRLSPFVRDVVTSALASAVIMGSLVLVTGWLAEGLGPVVFGVYGLSRRFLSTASSVSPGPLGVGLTRALAITSEERDRLAFLWAGTLLALGPAIAIVAAAWVVPELLADLVFSDRRYAAVLKSTAVMIAAMSVFAVLFAWLRGTGQMRRANLWQVWVLGVGPLVIAAWLARSGNLSLIIALMGAVAGTALVPLGMRLRAARPARVRRVDVVERVERLWGYTVPRLPSGLAYAGIFSIGPFLAPYFADLRHVGFLVAGQAVLRVVEGGTSGFGLVVLPKVAALQARKEVAALRDGVEDVLAMTLHLGLFATCQLAIWTPEIVAGWLGSSFEDAIPVIRILLVGVVPYLGYTMVRSIIDGLDERAINAHNIYLAFGVTAGLSLLVGVVGLGAAGLAAAGTAGLIVLGLSSAHYLHRTLGVSGERLALGLAMSFNALAAGLALLVRWVLGSALTPPARLAAGMATMLGALAIYLVVLRLTRVRWVVEVERRLMIRPLG